MKALESGLLRYSNALIVLLQIEDGENRVRILATAGRKGNRMDIRNLRLGLSPMVSCEAAYVQMKLH